VEDEFGNKKDLSRLDEDQRVALVSWCFLWLVPLVRDVCSNPPFVQIVAVSNVVDTGTQCARRKI